MRIEQTNQAALNISDLGAQQARANMDLPKIILVPTDFSSYAQEALDYALKLAKKLDARVYIMHAYLMPVAGWEGAWAFPGDMISQLETESRAKLDTTVKKACETLPGTSATFYSGDPRDGVIKAAKDLKADLIIMGTHGRRGLSRAIMGSVTETVIRHAGCPVLAVHHPKDVV
jgi:nucleotide-binding universal stress UspA family protein